jgi:hypothetical protein
VRLNYLVPEFFKPFSGFGIRGTDQIDHLAKDSNSAVPAVFLCCFDHYADCAFEPILVYDPIEEEARQEILSVYTDKPTARFQLLKREALLIELLPNKLAVRFRHNKKDRLVLMQAGTCK